MTYHIGTSGWQYDHWQNVFYPRELPKKDWLAYYAQRFETVELNNSFYREPTARSWNEWRSTAPSMFQFAVKVNRFITHFKRFKDGEASVKRAVEGASQLGQHLGPLLYQARPDFTRTPDNVKRIEEFLSFLPTNVQHALEFRHQSWYGEATFAQLRRHGVAFCCHDMFGSQTPLTATASFAYVRFHGPDGKYKGSYSDDSLRRQKDDLSSLAREVESVWIYFNNDDSGFAVKNAEYLQRLLA